jgi:hypothetical protein
MYALSAIGRPRVVCDHRPRGLTGWRSDWEKLATTDQDEFFTRYAELAEHMNMAVWWGEQKPDELNAAPGYSEE